jgi:DNA-binding transcriptional LysR family regulator
VEFRRLRYFVAVADHLSFRRAAEALQTSQPSLSQQIRGLEEELGVTLFERTKRRVRLTTAGAEYLAGVRSAIADIDACGERAREAQAAKRGTLSLGASGMVMIDHLPKVVRAFRAEYPDVNVALTIQRMPELIGSLRSGLFELAFSTAPEADAEIECRPLWAFPWRVVLPSDHALVRAPAVRLAELGDLTLITHPRRGAADGNAHVMELCRAGGLLPKAVKEVSEIADLETLLGLVACGLGFTILPSPFERISPPGVAFRPIADTQAALSISACRRRGGMSAHVQNFIRAAANVAVD